MIYISIGELFRVNMKVILLLSLIFLHFQRIYLFSWWDFLSHINIGALFLMVWLSEVSICIVRPWFYMPNFAAGQLETSRSFATCLGI